MRANYGVSLAEPYRPIIFKTVGYHNCLLNNSIKPWRCNLCLGSKLSSAQIEKIHDEVRKAAKINRPRISNQVKMGQSTSRICDYIDLLRHTHG